MYFETLTKHGRKMTNISLFVFYGSQFSTKKVKLTYVGIAFLLF